MFLFLILFNIFFIFELSLQSIDLPVGGVFSINLKKNFLSFCNFYKSQYAHNQYL